MINICPLCIHFHGDFHFDEKKKDLTILAFPEPSCDLNHNNITLTISCIDFHKRCIELNCHVVNVAKVGKWVYPITDCCYYEDGKCTHGGDKRCKICRYGSTPDLMGSTCWECWNGMSNHYTDTLLKYARGYC